ncbi:COG3014 family protein [Colwellia psychrerythraea]|uniref:Putative lipoprotein n=1 Tax=Colwellia psychrerythraea (strain 34H / ATCC BAA-681) TaxID=167879 RepID=Q489B6_COLP3|nr:lipoprotein [Colwellia psychrerythraea]AAZ26725.1 putative lipoprotein [Colwellia psychrerythraea 34H]
MLNIPSKISIILLLSLALSACAGTSFSDLFSNYNKQMQGAKNAQQQGNFEQAVSLLPERSESNGSYGLSLLEKARLEFLANNHTQSQQDFALVYRQVQQAEQAAKIQLSRGIENIQAVVSNDNATRYDIHYYEQSMLHCYQALNYLNQNDLSGALVEIRRANLVQQKALQANQQALFDSQEEMSKKGVSSESLASKYPSMSTAIGKVKNGFQNAYTFYLSGVLYEAAGQANDAYIDYKKALEIYPHNVTVQKDVWRLATKLGMTNDIQLFGNRFSSDITRGNHQTVDNRKSLTKSGQLVVLVEQGIIPSKQEVSIHLPIFTSHNDMRFYSLALPSYQNRLRQYSGLSLNYQGNTYQSQEIVRLQSLAAKQLQDEMPAIVTRQVVRLVAKEELRQQMSRKGGDVGNILAGLYNIASEKADTRSWSTLPDSIHILRLDLAPGQQEVELNINGSSRTITVEINEDRQTLVKLTSIGSYTNYQSINL